MGVQLQVVRRDLSRHRWQGLGLAVMVTIVTLLVAGGFRAHAMLKHSRDAWCERLHLADIEIRFQPALPGIAQTALAHPGVERAEERLLAEGQLLLADGTALPALLQVLPEEGPPRLSSWHLLEGRWPGPGEHAAVLERSIAKARGLRPGQRVNVRFEQQVRDLLVVGVALSPEHLLLPVHPEYALPLRDTVAIVGVSKAATEGIARADRVDSLLLALAAGADAQAVQDDLMARLPITVIEALPARRQPTYVFTDMILNAFEIYMPLVAGMLALVALSLLGLVLAHVVLERRGEAGVLLALGHPGWRLMGGYLLTALPPVVLGVLLGAVLHGTLARSIFQGYAVSVGYAPLVDPGPGLEVPLTALGCLIIAVLACALPAWWMVHCAPSRLLRPASALRPPSEGVVGRVLALARRVLRVPLAVAMGWAGIGRRRVATILAALALGACFAVITAFLSVHLTHLDEVADSVKRLGLDATVHFQEPRAEVEAIAEAVATGVACEPLLARRALVYAGEQSAWHRTLGCPLGPFTDGLLLARGRLFGADNAAEILVDHWMADAYGLQLGDELTLFAHAHAPEGVTLTVVGVLEGVSLGLAVLPLRTSQRVFDLRAQVTGLQVISSLEDVELERRLRTLSGVQTVYPRAHAVAQVRANFAGSEHVLVLALWLAIGVAVVFLGVQALMDVTTRSGDLAILRALGWTDRNLLALVTTEVLTRGLLALLLGMLLTQPLAHLLLDRISSANHYHMRLIDPLWLRLTIISAALVMIPLGAWPAYRQARGLPPARVLRGLVGQ